DFDKETVLGVFMGSRPNAGFSTAIVSAMEGGGALFIRYTETRPSPGVLTAQILTFPYHIAAIPKATATNVKFEKVQLRSASRHQAWIPLRSRRAPRLRSPRESRLAQPKHTKGGHEGPPFSI